MKITKIEVCDFRGFPGPAIYDFEFGGASNLLVYGENGSGKSSLFGAVREFFNRSKYARAFAELKNTNNPQLLEGHVKLSFDSGSIQTWPYGGDRPLREHPASRTALQVGCLDYRSLLETNFSQKAKTVNLFEIAVNHLVDRMEVPIGGGTARIGSLWQRTVASKPRANYKSHVARCLLALGRFNEAFEPILTPLMKQASQLLSKFPGCNFELEVSFQPIEYDLKSKAFTNQDLILSVRRNGLTVPNHHDFFNEAKLSAIGLVIYLAGLLNTVPRTSDYPKLLVLDDVLIGLDMQNRTPVLKVLAEYFSDWQVILMTHDKVWYEMVQLELGGKAGWRAYELYVDNDQSPVHYQREGGADFFLARARHHLAQNDLPAAANYARSAFEWKIRGYCDKRSVPVPYRKDPQQIKAEDFWQAAKNRALAKAGSPEKAELPKLFAEVDAWKKVVLNPLVHSSAVSITREEVRSAIDAVDKLRFEK